MALILIDSSIWIDHIRSPLADLAIYLGEQRVLQHPFVTAEVALGSMANRAKIVAMLGLLPQATVSDEQAFLDFIEERELFGTGLGFVDSHLLACAAAQHIAVWTRDKRLAVQAERLGLRHEP